jgi:uncharacterized protein YjbI with pentapeptide repeats
LRIQKFFEECDFSESIFSGDTQIKNCTFIKNMNFVSSVFKGKAEFQNVQFKSVTSFYAAEFFERVLFRVNFSESVNFNNSIFKEAVTFSGWRNINVSIGDNLSLVAGSAIVAGNGAVVSSKQTVTQKLAQVWHEQSSRLKSYVEHIIKFGRLVNELIKKRTKQLKRRFSTKDENVDEYFVFAKEGQLEGVMFYKPDQVVFNQVNMSQVYLLGTNFRGVRFIGVNWWQPELNRNGLHNELFIRNSMEGNFIHRMLPMLEESYRNIRVTLEENRDFSAAADFYVGEMEASNSRLNFFQKHFFSIPALYKAVSNYGTSVLVAFRILLYLLILHWEITLWLNYESIHFDIVHMTEVFQRSVKLLFFQTFENDSYGIQSSHSQRWADITLKILGLVQLALLVFAFRSRIKRH